MQKFQLPVRSLFLALTLAVMGAAFSTSACEGGYGYGGGYNYGHGHIVYREHYRPYYGCEYGRKVVVVVEAPVTRTVVVKQTPVVTETPVVVTENPAKLETPKVETPVQTEAPVKIEQAPVTETAQSPAPVQK